MWGIKIDDVVRAREHFEEALRIAAPGDPMRIGILLGLADAVDRLMSITPVLAGDELLPLELIEQAVSEATDANSRSFAERHLAMALLTRSTRKRGAPADLDRAIELPDRQRPVDDADATRVELLLAGALVARFRRGDDPADAERADALYPATLARLAPSADALLLTNAWQWGNWSAEREAWDNARQAFAHATAPPSGSTAPTSRPEHHFG